MFFIPGSGSKQVEEMIAELQGSIQKSLNKQGTADGKATFLTSKREASMFILTGHFLFIDV